MLKYSSDQQDPAINSTEHKKWQCKFPASLPEDHINFQLRLKTNKMTVKISNVNLSESLVNFQRYLFKQRNVTMKMS